MYRKTTGLRLHNEMTESIICFLILTHAHVNSLKTTVMPNASEAAATRHNARNKLHFVQSEHCLAICLKR